MRWYQNDTYIGSNMKLSLVSKRYPNNTNLNITKSTTTKGGKDAVVAVVNFKKLKEKGEEKMQAPYSSKEKEHYTGQAIRERMVELGFKEVFIEKLLKEYSMKKIEEKLDLLMEMRNIKSPAGWLRAALKNDYTTPHSHLNPPPSRGRKFVERECGNPKCRGLIHQTRLESAGRINPPPTKTKTNSKDNRILSTEEVRRRFKLLRHELMAMK